MCGLLYVDYWLIKLDQDKFNFIIVLCCSQNNKDVEGHLIISKFWDHIKTNQPRLFYCLMEMILYVTCCASD